MFKLNKIQKETLDWYYNLIENKIVNNINNSDLSDISKKFLNKNTLKSLLIGEPQIILDIHNAAHCELRNKTYLENIFDYKNIISNSKPNSYNIAKKIGTNTCTYCNRNYTLTIVYEDEQTKRENDSTRITRPQFDHFFSQKDFPLLALSIYNLIPSCSTCNSGIKGKKKLDLDKYLHPYVEEINIEEKDFKFSYELNTLSELSVKIKDCKENSKIKNTLDFFKIEEVYNAHANFELKDLYDLRTKYSDTFLEIIEKNFGGIMTKEESYRMIFGIEINEDDFHKRPFSKFKKDIIEELLRTQKKEAK